VIALQEGSTSVPNPLWRLPRRWQVTCITSQYESAWGAYDAADACPLPLPDGLVLAMCAGMGGILGLNKEMASVGLLVGRGRQRL